MSRKLKIFYDILTIFVTFALIFLVIFIRNTKLGIGQMGLLVLGALVFGILNCFFHELGHLIFGITNNFYLISISFFFINIFRQGKKFGLKFGFNDSFGSTEFVPKTSENLEIRFKRLTLGGIIFNLVLSIVGIFILIFNKSFSTNIFCFLGMLLPISFYFFLDNILPKYEDGVRNDGGVVYSLNKKDDISYITLSILKAHKMLYDGLTPSQLDKNLIFNLPQISEDESIFLSLLNLQYMFYVDCEDFVNAKKILERVAFIEEGGKSIPKSIKLEQLYSYCTFDFNEEKADETMYEIEKYLNKNNFVESVRTKLCYLLYIDKAEMDYSMFTDKLLREIERTPILGIKKYEEKLAEKIIKDIKKCKIK